MVVWKEIPNFGLYECSDAGQIRNKRTGKILKPQNEKYKKLTLYNGTKNTCKYHILAAKTFIPNPNNLPKVNHKDGNKYNNKVENLEWITHRGNIQHAYDTGLCENRKRRAVLQYDIEGNFIKEFKSLADASKETNSNKVSIGKVCMGTRLTAGGYTWKYRDEEDNNPVDDIDDDKIWQYVPGYGNYKISIDGRVYNTRKKKLRRITLSNSKDYLDVELSKKGEKETYRVHILVARAFIPNPNNLPIVNHKDGNKVNNHVDNLEWTTYKGNAQHAHDTGLNKSSKAVIQMDMQRNEIREFKSIAEAERFLGIINRSNIQRVCYNKLISCAGYTWKFKDENLVTTPPKLVHGKLKKVAQLDAEGNVIATFKSITDAQKQFKVKNSHISDVCRGTRSIDHGYKWRYVE